MVGIDLTDNLSLACDKNLIFDGVGAGTAQADHPFRFALSEIRQKSMGIENTGNNGGDGSHVVDRFTIVLNFSCWKAPSSTYDKSVITPGLRSPKRVVDTGL